MQDAEDHDAALAADEEDAVGKAVGQRPAHFGTAAETREAERVLGGESDYGVDLGEKLVTQVLPLTLVRDGGVGDVDLGFNG